MILAAGRGTRLKPLTDTIPKPLLPVRGKPLIHWQLEALAAAGFRDCVINLHHLGEQIENAVGDGATFGLQVSYSREETLLETGGAIVHALGLLSDEFVILNGDIWTDFDFATLPVQLSEEIDAQLVLTDKPIVRETGDFLLDDNRIRERGDDFVYCGISLFRKAIFETRPIVRFSLRDVFFELMEAGRLGGQRFTGTWNDIGTLEEYEILSTP